MKSECKHGKETKDCSICLLTLEILGLRAEIANLKEQLAAIDANKQEPLKDMAKDDLPPYSKLKKGK